MMPLGWLSAKVRGYFLLLFFLIYVTKILFLKKKQSDLFLGYFIGLYVYFFIQLFFNCIDTWYYSVMFWVFIYFIEFI